MDRALRYQASYDNGKRPWRTSRFASKVTTENSASKHGVVRAMARSLPWRWVSTPSWARPSAYVVLYLPAPDEPRHDLRRRYLPIRAQKRLGAELLLQITNQDPSEGHDRPTDSIPNSGARRNLEGAGPAPYQWGSVMRNTNVTVRFPGTKMAPTRSNWA